MKTTLLAFFMCWTVVWAPLSSATAQPVPGGSTNPPAPNLGPGSRTTPGGVTRPLRGQGPPGSTTAAPTPGTGPAPGTGPTAATTPGGTGTPGEQLISIPPSPSSTNAPAEDIIPAGVIRFPAVDLNQVLKVYAELVNRTVLRPTTLPAPTITLETQTPLTRSEARAAIDAVLALNGISVVNVGDKFVKVVPAAQAGQVGAPFSKAPTDQLPELGQFVTHVVQTTYVKPSELTQTLTPFASPGLANGILAVDTSQILVLRDYSENVKRMLEMIKKVDVSVPSEYISEVIPVKYALASEIANALNSLSSGGGGGTTVGRGGQMTGGTTIGGGSRMGYGGGYGSYGGGYGSYGGGAGSYGGGYGSYGGGYGGYGGYGRSYGGYGTTPFSSSITPLGTVAPGMTATPGTSGSFSDRLQRIIQKASKEGEIQVLGQTKIIADERTNSLLIFASRDDMKTIKDIVSKLDVVLAQVLIEAVIVEVTLNNSRQLAFSYLQKSPQGNWYRSIGAINNNNALTANSFTTAGGSGTSGGTNGLLPSGFSYLASLGGDLDISLTALAADSRARILQQPRIQTSHAVPAVLFVGQSRPYPTGSYYGGAAYGSYASIQQLQIGVTLQVTPLINPDGLVVMDIDQQIDSFQGNVTIQGVGDVPITSSKHATAKVAVRDHDTIMLGGLIENSKNNSNSGVPFLKDIPLLGPLFRSTSQDSTRNELIVLIRPTVLPTPEVAALTAKAEQRKLPEINKMQKETEESEAQRVKRADDQIKSHK